MPKPLGQARYRRTLAAFAVVLVTIAYTLVASATPAYATAGTGALTIAASGGSTEGTGWTYSAGVLKTASDAAVTVNAAAVIAKLDSGDLTIEAGSITVNADVVATTGSSNLTFKSLANINVGRGVNIETLDGGDITFHANSDGVGPGSIRLGDHLAPSRGSVTSNGGDIVLSGGLNPATGFASASADYSSGTGPKPWAGIAIYGFDVDAGGGNIIVRGTTGITQTNTRGVLIGGSAATPSKTTFVTTGNGNVTIVGQGNPAVTADDGAGGFTNVGISWENGEISTVAGDILLSGAAVTQGTSANKRGMALGGLVATAASGDIRIEETSDTSISGLTGFVLLSPITLVAPLGKVDIRSDIFRSVTTMTFESPEVTIYPYSDGASFFRDVANLGIIKANEAGAPTTAITIGREGNTAGITVDGAVDVNGSLTINGGTVAVNQRVDATGVIEINTWTGNLTLANVVASSASTGDSVKLYADKSELVDRIGDGHIVVSGSGAISVQVGARALLYSGTEAASTGLVTLVGGTANTRTRVAAATNLAAVSPALASTGVFALFRVDPEVGEIIVYPETGEGIATGPSRRSARTTVEDAPTAELAATGAPQIGMALGASSLLTVAGIGFVLVGLGRRWRLS
jgi:hypothetical protein